MKDDRHSRERGNPVFFDESRRVPIADQVGGRLRPGTAS